MTVMAGKRFSQAVGRFPTIGIDSLGLVVGSKVVRLGFEVAIGLLQALRIRLQGDRGTQNTVVTHGGGDTLRVFSPFSRG
jgi:hypothetical protein